MYEPTSGNPLDENQGDGETPIKPGRTSTVLGPRTHDGESI